MDGQMSLSDIQQETPKIYVKPKFSDWNEVDRETATAWATYQYRTLPKRLNREEEINSRLRGITYAELMEGNR